MQTKNINQAIENALPKSKNRLKLYPHQIAALTKISEVVLAVVATAGIITLSAVAPNIFVAIDKIIKLTKPSKNWSKAQRKAKIKRAFYYLKQTGLIQLRTNEDNIKIALTKKGENRLGQIDLKSRTIPHIKKWDGRWWLVAADIPTLSHRYAADLFRKKLKQMGFYTFQRTLWLYPFNPIDEIQFIAEQFGLEKYVTVMEVIRVDVEDERIMKQFFRSKNLI